MFVFNRLPCEFQVKKLHCPRKFTCQPGRRKGVCKITPKSDGKLSFTLVVQFVGHTGIRDASAAPFKAFRPRRNNQHLPICGQRLLRPVHFGANRQAIPVRAGSLRASRRHVFPLHLHSIGSLMPADSVAETCRPHPYRVDFSPAFAREVWHAPHGSRWPDSGPMLVVSGKIFARRH